MAFTIENEEAACRKKLVVTVEADKVQSAFDAVVDDFKKYAEIPGYRKGRAPATMIKSRFKKKIVEQVQDQLVPESYREALKGSELKIANVVSASDPELVLGEPMTFEVVLDVEPEFDVADYKGVSVTKEVEEFEDDKVEEVILNIREGHATFEDKKDGEQVEENDLVQISYKGTLDGKELAGAIEGLPPIFSGQDDFWTQANEAMGRGDGPSVIPGLGTVLVGLAVGDSTDTDVEFEADSNAPEDLQGKTVNYHVTVTAARGRTLPEMDDAMASEVGFDTVAALREDIEANMKNQFENNATAKVRQDILEQVVGSVEFEMPVSLVEEETRREIYERVNQFSRQGVQEDMISEHKGEIFEAANAQAKARLKAQYVCRKIADAEEIKVEAQEVEMELQQMAMRFGMEYAELRKRLIDNGRIEGVQTDLLVKKTLDFLVEHADIQG